MSSYRDKAGVWAVYDYSEGARVSTIHSDVVPAVREADSFETVFFWPFDMDLDPAIEWWRKAEGPPPPTPEDWTKLKEIIRVSLSEEDLKEFGVKPEFITGMSERLANQIFVEYLEEVAR